MRILASIPSLTDGNEAGGAPASDAEHRVSSRPRAAARRHRGEFPTRSIVLLAAVAAATWGAAWWRDREHRLSAPERIAQAPAAAVAR